MLYCKNGLENLLLKFALQYLFYDLRKALLPVNRSKGSEASLAEASVVDVGRFVREPHQVCFASSAYGSL